MSNCNNCGKEVNPSWKFCRYCGKSLVQEEEVSVSVIKVEFERDTYFKVLASRADRILLNDRKEKINKEIGSLLEQLEAGLITRDYALPQVKSLKAKVEEIKIEEEKFEGLPDKLPVEILNEEMIAAKERIRKIDDLKSDPAITKDTIREAKDKAQNAYENLKSEQSQIFGYLRSWKSELKAELEESRKELEMLYVRVKTGELTEEAYNNQKEQKSKKTSQISTVIDLLEQMIK